MKSKFSIATRRAVGAYRTSDICKALCGSKPFGSRHWEYPWAVAHSGILDQSSVKILDVAPDFTFPYAHYLESAGHDVHFIDLEKRKWAPNVTWGAAKEELRENYRVMDVRDMTFPDEMFDVIFCISVLEHIVCPTQNPEDPQIREIFDPYAVRPALKEMRRCLKRGGRLMLTVDIYGGKKWDELFEQWDIFSDFEYAGFDISDFPHFDCKAAFSDPRTFISSFHGPYITLGFALYK